MAGVQQQGGDWLWACTCGASGEPKADREQVREDYKAHRKTCNASTQGVKTIMSTEAKQNVAAPKAAKAAKKAPAAKKEGGRKKREQSVSEADAKKALAALKKGDTTLLAESKKLGFTHNGPLRAALRGLIGEKAYSELMQGSKKPAKAAPAAKKGKPATKKGKPAAKKVDAPEQVPQAVETPAPVVETEGAVTA